MMSMLAGEINNMGLKKGLAKLLHYYAGFGKPAWQVETEYYMAEFFVDSPEMTEGYRVQINSHRKSGIILRNILNALELFILYLQVGNPQNSGGVSNSLLAVSAFEAVRFVVNSIPDYPLINGNIRAVYPGLEHESLEEIAERHELRQQEKRYGNGEEWKS